MIQKKPHYLITKVGPEGFSEFLYLSEDKDWSVNFVKSELQKEKANKDILHSLMEKSGCNDIYDWEDDYLEKEIELGNITKQMFWDIAYKTDTYCLQEWDGEKFRCICGEEGLDNPKFFY